jgi:DNA-directed RNA polymerase subunit RPC12/RpoP
MLPHQIKCHYCGKAFEPKTYRNVFCCRRCFITFYRLQSKISKYPRYICPGCGKSIELNFHPKSSREKWNNFKCPYCKKGWINFQLE